MWHSNSPFYLKAAYGTKLKKNMFDISRKKKHHNGRYHDMYLTTSKETLENILSKQYISMQNH